MNTQTPNTSNSINPDLIAACGMNCGLCMAHQRAKNVCPGCHGAAESLPKYCRSCIIRNCPEIEASSTGFCYNCEKFPCRRLKQLDKRYRTRYGMSMLQNLEFIRDHGLKEFIAAEELKWECPKCSGTLSVHRSACMHCGDERTIPSLL